jgi:GTP cyclohydrolase I
MSPTEHALCTLPDVALESGPEAASALAWVGMRRIEAPVLIAGPEGLIRCPARIAAAVNLVDARARGIHMSRLYLLLDQWLTREPLSPSLLRRVLRAFIDSHRGLSDRARLSAAFDFLVRRRALVSEHSGWRAYPVAVSASLDPQSFQVELAVAVDYSSTCPCSAALARQIVQRRFEEAFPPGAPLDRERILAWLGAPEGIAATPHGQRSRAEVRVRLRPGFGELPILDLIDLAERALGTPVQAAVKREDEQAFAVLNGENPMFCEDAARRLARALDGDERFLDFWARASHFESLHPHDAVAVAVKGVPGGYRGGLQD